MTLPILIHSYMLTGLLSLLSNRLFAQARAQHNHVGHWRLAGRDIPTATFTPVNFAETATPCVEGPDCVQVASAHGRLPCESVNGTTIVAGPSNFTWAVLCDIDFFEQDIFPFILATTFQQCLEYCDDYNVINKGGCAGFVFAPDRVHLENSCYLKSSLKDAIHPSTIHLIGATMVPQAVSQEVPDIVRPTIIPDPSNHGIANALKEMNLTVSETKILGRSQDDPATQYVVHPPLAPQKFSKGLIQPGVNLDLITNYPLAPDTGSWTTNNAPTQLELANMTLTPRMSRDGGRGGNINGTHIFMFCDTSTYGVEETELGYMNGFVSSSAAISEHAGHPHDLDHLVLKDTVGQWQDDVGRLRGWIEMTTGEQAFNIEISGNGYRYAVWPDSSFIQYNSTHALMYAPVVYVEVDMATQNATFKALGNTLILISIDDEFGPHADRVQTLIFSEPDVEWGSLGGLRAWGASGNDTMDGVLYLFGAVEKGVLVAKVAPRSIEDPSAYEFWDGQAWSNVKQQRDSQAYLIEQPVMALDVFYAPAFNTFIMVYLTPHADNTFYYRYLQVDQSHPVLPPYVTGGSEDYCERILQGQEQWSEPQMLLKPDAPAIGYIYAGGAHMGYFGIFDIALGGEYLLLTWTEHTEKIADDPASGYAHKSAWVRLQSL